jgi:hypothetical protein
MYVWLHERCGDFACLAPMWQNEHRIGASGHYQLAFRAVADGGELAGGVTFPKDARTLYELSGFGRCCYLGFQRGHFRSDYLVFGFELVAIHFRLLEILLKFLDSA